jgi:hypothetical protein
MMRHRAVWGVALLALVTSASLCREDREPAAPDAPAAFASPENEYRYYTNVRSIFPDAGLPADFAGPPADGDPAPEGEGEPAGGEEAEEEEEEDAGPPEVPKPAVLEGNWFHVAASGNWAGVPEGGESRCPCETAFVSKLGQSYFAVDPRRPNPPNPDPGNGLFPAIWRRCLAPIPVPPDGPPHDCAPPCTWRTTRIDDWSLSREPNGTFRLTCWKLKVFHCDLDSLPPPPDVEARRDLGRGVPVL